EYVAIFGIKAVQFTDAVGEMSYFGIRKCVVEVVANRRKLSPRTGQVSVECYPGFLENLVAPQGSVETVYSELSK
ncbi:MAG: hypothetical protein WD400_00145, partial [Pontimonas sp.]